MQQTEKMLDITSNYTNNSLKHGVWTLKIWN